MSDKEWTKEYIKNLSEFGQRLQDLLAVKIEELATKDEEIALLRQEFWAAKANSPEKPDGSELAFKSIEPAREVFRICYTSDGFDIKLADGVTMTEAAEMFINMVKGRLATKEE